jgi:transcriptional regulator with XRE-family HTH domain
VPSADDLRSRRRNLFGERLRNERTQVGLTQEALALKAGLDRSFYVEIETARHSVTLDRVWDLADALDVPVAQLFDDPAFSPPGDA